MDFFFFLQWVIISLVKRKHRKHPIRQGVKLTSFTVFYPKRHSCIYMFVRLSGAVATDFRQFMRGGHLKDESELGIFSLSIKP